MLSEHRDDDSGEFGALTLMDCSGVGRHQRVEFAKPVGDGASVESGGEFAIVGIDVFNVANVAVVDLLVVGFSVMTWTASEP
jgi:hypothetical protein